MSRFITFGPLRFRSHGWTRDYKMTPTGHTVLVVGHRGLKMALKGNGICENNDRRMTTLTVLRVPGRKKRPDSTCFMNLTKYENATKMDGRATIFRCLPTCLQV